MCQGSLVEAKSVQRGIDGGLRRLRIVCGRNRNGNAFEVLSRVSLGL